MLTPPAGLRSSRASFVGVAKTISPTRDCRHSISVSVPGPFRSLDSGFLTKRKIRILCYPVSILHAFCWVIVNLLIMSSAIIPKRILLIPALLIYFGASLFLSANSDPLEDAVNIAGQDAQRAVEAQRTIDELADETDDLLAEYRLVLSQLENLNRYNQQMLAIVEDQESEMGTIRGQLAELETTRRDLTPLMFAMLETLEELIQTDIPFLLEERTNRLATLQELMTSSRVTIGERYRRIMEAYQIEMDYARNIESYSGHIELDGSNRTVNFLRLGRLALYFQTLDGQRSGIWDARNNRWHEVSSASARLGIQTGIRIAQRQAAPDILQLPLPRPRP